MISYHLDYPHLAADEFPRGAVLAIGTFDGVHLGHRQLFETAQRLAADLDCPAAVFTFVEHPRSILNPGAPVPLLTPWQEKEQRLREAGLSHCIATRFSQALSRLTPEAFVARVLGEALAVKGVVTGFNFRFGHQQAGTPEDLQRLGKAIGFPVEVVPPVRAEGGIVSSSRLRQLIEGGQVEEAQPLLGYAYTLTGQVVPGDQRGRTIGFPTANLALPADKLLPLLGVYACLAEVGSEQLPAVVNIGRRPTFDGVKLLTEVHLLAGGRDLYGQTMTISLLKHLRPERAFPGAEALIAQIADDCEAARQFLARVTADVAIP